MIYSFDSVRFEIVLLGDRWCGRFALWCGEGGAVLWGGGVDGAGRARGAARGHMPALSTPT